MFGVGGGGSRFLFPDTYAGAKAGEFDDKATLLGGVAQLGYDTLLFRRIVLGLRAEGSVMDTMAMGNNSSNRLNGRTRTAHVLLRLGGVFRVKTFDPVGDPARMSLEVFLEGGPTSGHRSFSKRYTPAGGDQYNGSFDEEYQGQVLGGGLNLTTAAGAFFELKALHTRMSERSVFLRRENRKRDPYRPFSDRRE